MPACCLGRQINESNTATADQSAPLKSSDDKLVADPGCCSSMTAFKIVALVGFVITLIGSLALIGTLLPSAGSSFSATLNLLAKGASVAATALGTEALRL